jgi:WD40 repeat protein
VEGREKAQSLSGHNGAVTSLAFDPQGRLLASGGEDGALKIWDSRRGWELARLEGHEGPVRFIAWHLSGLFLVSGDGSSLRFWGVAHQPKGAKTR